MPFITSLRQALSATILFYAISTAQTCYFPDGVTVSDDIPCDASGAASACCSSDSFCMSNGMCVGGGVVSRGSCTDKTWGSDACAGYCKTDNPSAGIAITPCTSDGGASTFVCGLNSTDCQSNSNTWTMSGAGSIVLRPDQVAAAVTPALSNAPPPPPNGTDAAPVTTVTACPSPDSAATNTTGLYTSGEMAGLGCGLGLPLGFALIAALILLRREKQKHAKPKLMYKLPDDVQSEFSFRPPPIPGRRVSEFSPSPLSNSRRASMKTVGSTKPAHVQSFLERYETMKKSAKVSELDLGRQRHELDGAPPYENVRHELAEVRMSK